MGKIVDYTEYFREYREENRERIRNYDRRYREKQSELIKTSKQKYEIANKDGRKKQHRRLNKLRNRYKRLWDLLKKDNDNKDIKIKFKPKFRIGDVIKKNSNRDLRVYRVIGNLEMLRYECVELEMEHHAQKKFYREIQPRKIYIFPEYKIVSAEK